MDTQRSVNSSSSAAISCSVISVPRLASVPIPRAPHPTPQGLPEGLPSDCPSTDQGLPVASGMPSPRLLPNIYRPDRTRTRNAALCTQGAGGNLSPHPEGRDRVHEHPPRHSSFRSLGSVHQWSGEPPVWLTGDPALCFALQCAADAPQRAEIRALAQLAPHTPRRSPSSRHRTSPDLHLLWVSTGRPV